MKRTAWQTLWLIWQFGTAYAERFARSCLSNALLRLHPAVEMRGWITVTGPVDFRIHPQSKVEIGRSVRINSGSRINSVGGHRRTVICVHKNAQLSLRDGVGISSSTIVAHTRIEIGECALVGGNAEIYDSDFHPLRADDRHSGSTGNVRSASVCIGACAFIGTGAKILKGVSIGAGSVIGAGSIVTRAVPAQEVWAGTPAKLIYKI